MTAERFERQSASHSSKTNEGIHAAVQDAYSRPEAAAPRIEPPSSSNAQNNQIGKPKAEDSSNEHQAPPSVRSLNFSASIAVGYPGSDVKGQSPENLRPSGASNGNPGSDVQGIPQTAENSRPGSDTSAANFGFSCDKRQNFEQKPQPTPGQMYQIKAGDNVWNIASRAQSGGDASPSAADTSKFGGRIAQENNMSNPNLVKPGEQIQIPQR